MYSTNSREHPLPAPPGQKQDDQRPQQRNRAQSSFTVKSHKSNNSGGKIDLHETHAEKKQLTTHADPTMAMTELEPSAVAKQQSTLAPIRAIQHRDHLGNPIADPDRSNPTRNRWERPLDTIRSFEAAIDGNYRKSYIRNDGESSMNLNRRSSYFGGTQVTSDDRMRFSQHGQGGSYGGRSQSQRPESYLDGRASYYNQGDNGQGPSNGYYPNRSRYPRTASEPQFNNGKGIYPGPGNQQSYETVTTASGSGSSAEAAGYSTDPSSENSSMDRIAPLPRESGENYGFIGFNGNSEHPQASYGSSIRDQTPRSMGQKPTVLRKESSGPRVPIKLGQTSGNAGPPPVQQRPAPVEKRKSWLSRRFSKSG